MKNIRVVYCVKSVRIRNFSAPYFAAFGLNTERYSLSLRIQSECGKILTRKNLNTDVFYASGSQNPVKHLKWSFFAKVVNGLKLLLQKAPS